MLSRYLNRGGLNSCHWYASINFKSTNFGGTQRQFAVQVELKSDAINEDLSVQWEQARPYSEIPGPTKIQFLRAVMPGGEFYNKSITDLAVGYSKRYGNLIRLPGMFGKRDLLMAFNPDDFRTIFRNEGIWPKRRNFDSLVYFREVHRRDFFQGVEGIITTSGEKWANVRSIVNPILMQPKNVRPYVTTMQEVNNEFLMRIREIRDPLTLEMPDTFEDEINRLTFESVSAVALNTQLGLIRKNRDSEESKVILKSMQNIVDLAYDLDILPSLWKIVKTPKFHHMMSTCDNLLNVISKYIDEAISKLEKNEVDGKTSTELNVEKSVLEKLLQQDRRVAVVMALDMLFAGVDTTSTSLAGILLCLAKNPDKQEKLREELRIVLPHKDSMFTVESMKNLPYLRACIKEGIRMYPIGPGTLRALPVDVVLSGFQVPKGIDISISNNLLAKEEKYVPYAKQFLPERWLRNDSSRLSDIIFDPFLYLPFGFGPRSCAGKRIVDLEMEITIARLVRNFNIEFNYSVENAFKAKFINVPAIPLKFKFAEVAN